MAALLEAVDARGGSTGPTIVGGDLSTLAATFSEYVKARGDSPHGGRRSDPLHLVPVRGLSDHRLVSCEVRAP